MVFVIELVNIYNSGMTGVFLLIQTIVYDDFEVRDIAKLSFGYTKRPTNEITAITVKYIAGTSILFVSEIKRKIVTGAKPPVVAKLKL